MTSQLRNVTIDVPILNFSSSLHNSRIFCYHVILLLQNVGQQNNLQPFEKQPVGGADFVGVSLSRCHSTCTGTVGCWWRFSERCVSGCYRMDKQHASHTGEQRYVRNCLKRHGLTIHGDPESILISHPLSPSLTILCKRFIDLLFPYFDPVYSTVALSAVSGQMLWKKVMQESVMYIQCGLRYNTQLSPVVILISKSIIMAVNGTTGEKTTLHMILSVSLFN